MRDHRRRSEATKHRADIGHVEVVRVLYYFAAARKKKNLKVGRNCTWKGWTG